MSTAEFTAIDVHAHFGQYRREGAGVDKYAGVILGGKTWVIKPKTAKKLTIPVGDNIGPGGQAIYVYPFNDSRTHNHFTLFDARTPV